MERIFFEPMAHWVRDSNLWLDPVTGEAISENILDSDTMAKAYIPSGFFFDRAYQRQPNPVMMETGRVMVDIPDWAFASAQTAEQVASFLRDAMPELNYALVREGAQNERAPYSQRPRVVFLSSSRGGMAVVNAGLVAHALARHASYDPTSGQVRRNWKVALGELVAHIRLQLSESAAQNNQVVDAGAEAAAKFQVRPVRP
jgi:hypothetical protein